MLFDRGLATWRNAAAASLLAVASAALRLRFADGEGLPFLPHLPMIAVAVLLATILVAAWLSSSARHAIARLVAFIALTLAAPCYFHRDDNVAYAEQAIRSIAGNRLPHFYYDRRDPVGLRFLDSVTASFTERAWVQHGSAFPDVSTVDGPAPAVFRSGDLVVILSSAQSDVAAVRSAIETYLGEVHPIGSLRLERSGFLLWAHCFELLRPGNDLDRTATVR